MRKASKESDGNQERLGEQPMASLQPSLRSSNPATDTESNLGGDWQPARLTASQQVVNAEVTTSSRLVGSLFIVPNFFEEWTALSFLAKRGS